MSSSTAAQVARPANAGPAPRQEEESTMKKIMGIVQQVLLAYIAMQFISKFFGSTPASKEPPPSPVTSGVAPAITPGQIVPPAANIPVIPTHAYPAWPLGIPLSMHVYLNTNPKGDVFSRKWTSGYRKNGDEDLPHFVWENITFGDWKESRTAEYDVKLPPSVQHNGSMWADVFLVKDGASPDPNDSKFDPDSVHQIRKLLTHYLPKTKIRKEKNLLNSKEQQEAEEAKESEEGDVIVSHWHKNMTIALISDGSVVPATQLPAPVAQHITLLPERDETGTKGFYRPIIFPNEFWHLRSQYIEINETTPVLPIQITFQPMTYWKFQIFATMTASFKEAAKQQGAASVSEMDEIKRMLVETNPYFLALTGLVSLLHVLFEFLAFSSDVAHWRTKKEMVGVSLRSPPMWSYRSLSCWVLIEAWKITKAVDISIAPASPGSLLPYKINVKDKHVLSEDEKKTQEYDKLAFRYVSYVAIPCLAGYTIYSLLYETHRGWYSFVISTLTSFVYMFGFVQLVPQLIINYKLKSVAHMPMKAMIFKTLSTVVDDLFAFCIKMPILHRLACFRDDVVFLVFLYQRWIYRIDPKRVNEYGQVMVSDADTIAEKDGKADMETKKNK
ncbi:hypothetical protein QCA50_000678 [Cerrena zonata]|uniref:Cleft lip and palate associated transmembrane protein n=1 Tax=Cerrena zonata TaxID=2478898 RepID=A0AAW0GTL7_9APHY